MTVNVLLITHEKVGSALLRAVSKTFGELPLPVKAVTIDYQCDPDRCVQKLRRLTKCLTWGDEVLVLTDVPGSTPCKIAQKLCYICHSEHVRVIAGINLPMLMRIMNYPSLSLNQLAQKAVSGGKEGIMSLGETR
jgi:mannose PTS system EIIA component